MKLIKSKDGEICAARLKTGKSYIEQAIQLLCPMELSCNIVKDKEELNPQAKKFIPNTSDCGGRERVISHCHRNW